MNIISANMLQFQSAVDEDVTVKEVIKFMLWALHFVYLFIYS
jgi:hypothetical protein